MTLEMNELILRAREAVPYKDDYDDWEDPFSREIYDYASLRMYRQIVVAVIDELQNEAIRQARWDAAGFLRSHLGSSGQNSGQNSEEGRDTDG